MRPCISALGQPSSDRCTVSRCARKEPMFPKIGVELGSAPFAPFLAASVLRIAVLAVLPLLTLAPLPARLAPSPLASTFSCQPLCLPSAAQKIQPNVPKAPL